MSQVYLQRVAAAGIAFLGVQTFDWYRGQRSAVLLAKEREAAGTAAAGTISLQEWLDARRALKGSAPPLLSVSNFTLENMEGTAKGAPNSSSVQ